LLPTAQGIILRISFERDMGKDIKIMAETQTLLKRVTVPLFFMEELSMI